MTNAYATTVKTAAWFTDPARRGARIVTPKRLSRLRGLIAAVAVLLVVVGCGTSAGESEAVIAPAPSTC